MKKIVEITLHLLFWFVVLIIFPYVSYVGMVKNGYKLDPSFFDFLIHSVDKTSVLYYLGYLAGFYLLYFLVSYALHKKRIVRFIIYCSWSLFISFLLILVVKGVIIHVIFTSFFIIYSSTGLFAGVTKGVILWLLRVSEERTLQKRQLESENALLLLKAQLNPHFLFNSLNNIDILIEESPQTASEYLKKLSDILRYVLYETKEDETTLSREIDQIKNYIELQRIRTANLSYVDFEVTGVLGEQKIVPMFFLPFIENAFKFSKNKVIDHAIDIRFHVSEKSVHMSCKNFYEARRLDIIKNEGLGIETIRKRLNLIYPRKHRLEIRNSENWFTVSLQIDF